MNEARPPKDNHRYESGTLIRRTKIRKKNREAVERARETMALAHQALANARQLITEAAAIYHYNQARREHKAEQGRIEDRPQVRHSRIVPLTPSGLVAAYERGGQEKQRMARLTQAGAFGDTTEARHGATGVDRGTGWLPLQPTARGRRATGEEAAETSFRKAIELAQRHHATAWELRAAMRLARLWLRQGRKEEAHQLLAEVYGWCTEGLDTKDWHEAKALLEE
jgi:hypothetical protein